MAEEQDLRLTSGSTHAQEREKERDREREREGKIEDMSTHQNLDDETGNSSHYASALN